jgi:hypothetical protein
MIGMRWLLSASVVAAVCVHGWAQPVIQIHEGRCWTWYAQQDQYEAHKADIEALYSYADGAYQYLTEAWGLAPPASRYALLVWPKTGGGFAAGDIGEVGAAHPAPNPGIGISYDAFHNVHQGVKAFWAYAIITHEMVNLFTGQIVSGGWPVDWWADHISPFPLMTAVQIEYALKPDVAVIHAAQAQGPLDHMFARLHDQFGWAMFRRAFRAAIRDGINWASVGGNPSPLLTNYVCAYLQLGAPEGLRPYLQGAVPGYDAGAVAGILAARGKWRALPEGDPRRAKLKEAYLRGRYQ